jgi:hypothetical protein
VNRTKKIVALEVAAGREVIVQGCGYAPVRRRKEILRRRLPDQIRR